MDSAFRRRITSLVLMLSLCLMTQLTAETENWDYFRYGGRDIHAMAQEDSILWVATDIGLVTINLDTDEKQFIDVRDGLPYPMISSITIDDEGNKWFGTGDNWIHYYGAGVLKFDGENWEVFNKDNTDMFQNGVWAVFIDSSGIVWVGGGETMDCMLFSYDGTTWTRHMSAEVIRRRVNCFEEDDKGNLWIGTARGLLKYDGSDFTHFDTQNSPLPSVHVHDLIYSEGKLWMGLFGGVVCLDDTVWTCYDTLNSSLPSNEVYDLACDTQGNIWAATLYGLAKFDGTDWVKDTALGTQKVRAVLADDRGGLWAAMEQYDMDQGLFKKEGAVWRKYSTYTNELHTDRLQGVRVDRHNNKWFGSASGLIKYDGLNWTRYYDGNSNIRFPYVMDMEFDSTGNLWAAIRANYLVGSHPYGELVWYDGTKWDSLEVSKCGLETSYVFSIAFSPFNDLWIATDKGAASYDGNSWVNYTYENGKLPHNWVYDVCPLATEVWFGTYLGLVHLSGNGVEVFDHENSILPHPTVISLMHDGNKLWAATPYGIVTFDGENWELFSKYNSIIPDMWTYDIQKIKKETWLATDRGVFRYSEGEWTAYQTGNSGILGNEVWGLAIDTLDNVWLPCYGEGVSIFDADFSQSCVEEIGSAFLPESLCLFPNYPNPFNPTTTIGFDVRYSEHVKLQVFDIKGRLVTTLVDEYKEAGHWKVTWDASHMCSGLYIYRIQMADRQFSRKMILMK